MGRRVSQACVTAGLLVVALAAFRGVEELAPPRFSLVSRVDEAIPFWPATIFIYQSLLFFLIGSASLMEWREAVVLWQRTALAVGAALICFFVVPAEMPRPPTNSIANAFIRARLVRLWELDRPSNTFPSLHVAFTWVAVALLWPRRRLRWVASGAAVAISLSTLTVKQHTVVDVLGGVALAMLVCRALPLRSGARHAPAEGAAVDAGSTAGSGGAHADL